MLFIRHYRSDWQKSKAGPVLGRLRLDADLKEIHCGIVDGMPIADVERRHAALWQRNLRQDDDAFRWPGGESYDEPRRRSIRAMDTIAAAHPGERVAVVTHCGVISQVIGSLHGCRPARWECFRPQNTSPTVVRWSQGRPELLG